LAFPSWQSAGRCRPDSQTRAGQRSVTAGWAAELPVGLGHSSRSTGMRPVVPGRNPWRDEEASCHNPRRCPVLAEERSLRSHSSGRSFHAGRLADDRRAKAEPPVIPVGAHAMTIVVELAPGDPGTPPHRHPFRRLCSWTTTSSPGAETVGCRAH
jgi:hypothetical protein